MRPGPRIVSPPSVSAPVAATGADRVSPSQAAELVTGWALSATWNWKAFVWSSRRTAGFGDWSCDWASSDGERAYAGLQFTQDNDLSDNGQRAKIAGTTGYVSPKEEGDDSCVVYTPRRTYTNSAGERTVERFQLTLRERQRPNAKVWADAKALAGTAVKAIAKNLPGK